MSQPTESSAFNPSVPTATGLNQPPHPGAALPREGEVRELFHRGKNGAAWFYWIAILSAINTVIALSAGGLAFALGLTVTMIGDTIASESALKPGGNLALLFVALGFDAVVLGLLVVCGKLAQRRVLPIYAIGMGLYLLDGLLCLLLGNIVGIVIHAYALWSMWSGFLAYRRLNLVEQHMLSAGAPFGGGA